MLTIDAVQQRVIQAEHLHIAASNAQNDESILDMSNYTGLLEYYPEELVMTVKAGTRIIEIEQILAEQGQAFSFTVLNSDIATIGGAYAVGSPELRDAVLGIKIIDGQGRILTFGGQVMKNVAGYDVSRLLVGSRGKLAVICEISFKVLPQHYVTDIKPTDFVHNTSAVVTRIERGLKSIFDPNDVFI